MSAAAQKTHRRGRGNLKTSAGLHESLLDAPVAHAALTTALEMVEAPAFVAHRGGQIDLANRAAAALLERDEQATRVLVGDVIAGRSHAGRAARLEQTPSATRYLVVLNRSARSTTEREAKLAAATRDWRLSPRELDVLRGLVHGDANKEIASALACSEVNVERHVTSMLRKADCENRARLIVRFWTSW